jgi:deazaflavin-dependent oxidoreductase (nitroreductase family)
MMEGNEKTSTHFMRPSLVDRFVNRFFGFLVRMGFGLSHNFMLEVRGRKSGRIYSTPVNVLEYKGAKYLVAPRGYTQWVRNVVANKSASLVKGSRREEVGLSAIADNEKPEILKAYLDRYKRTVQRYFPIPAGSPATDFEPLVNRYPVFEITAKNDDKSKLSLNGGGNEG